MRPPPLCATLLWIALSVSYGCAARPTDPNRTQWMFLPGHVETYRTPAFRQGRLCYVYLPPHYAETTRSYPVLYVNDGERAFDGGEGMHLNRYCDELIRKGDMVPIIVVAVTAGPWPQRIIDYSPWPDFLYPESGGGILYLRALRDSLKPAIDAHYRTLRDPGNTGIAGMSIGGLSAAYAAYAFDSTFGCAAALSPSYWFSFDRMLDVASAHGRPAFLRKFYQSTGYPHDNEIDDMVKILLSQGLTLGVQFMSVTVPEAEHEWPAFERRLPEMLRFLYAP